MDFEAILPFALLLIPGAFTQYLIEQLSPGKSSDSDFNRIINSLLFGCPVLVLNSLVTWLFYPEAVNLQDLNTVLELTKNISFYFVWFGASAIFGFLWALVVVCGRPQGRQLLAWLQQALGQPLTSTDQPWDMIFLNSDLQAVEVTTPDGRTVRGFVKAARIHDGDVKELLLCQEEVISEYRDYFTEVKRVYVNTQSGVIVRELDLGPYLQYRRELGE